MLDDGFSGKGLQITRPERLGSVCLKYGPNETGTYDLRNVRVRRTSEQASGP